MPKINEEKKQQKRAEIIDAAMKCFAEKGFNKTTMDDIVKTAGISKGGIYLYFKSKDEVFQAIADNVLIKRKSILSEFSEKLSCSEKLKKYLWTIVQHYNKAESKKKIRVSFEFWVENRDKKTIGKISKKKYLNKRFTSSSEDIYSIFREGIATGEFREDLNIDTVIYLIFSTIDGLAFYSGILDHANPDDVPDVFSDLIEQYVKK